MNTIVTQNQAIIKADDLGQALAQFDQAADRFIITRKSTKTQKAYRYALQTYRNIAEQLEIDPLKADCIIAYNTSLQDRELANDTKRLRLKSVQSFFTWLYTFGLSSLKPELVSELMTMPEARQLSPRDLLSEDEAQRLLKASSVFPDDHCLITLMLNAGLRLSEVLALKSEDVYQVGQRCFVRVESGKGGKSREVPIKLATLETVQSYATGLDSDRLLFADVYPRKVQRIITKQARRAGIDKPITPHSLRHTYANKLAELGTPLELIGECLGHASYDVTKIYTRPGELLKRAELPALPW